VDGLHGTLANRTEVLFTRRRLVTLKPLDLVRSGSSGADGGSGSVHSPVPRRPRTWSTGSALASPATSRPGSPLAGGGGGSGLKRTWSTGPVMAGAAVYGSVPGTPSGSAPGTPKRRRSSGGGVFDIDRVVIPLNALQSSVRITPLEFKEIHTPTWRVVVPFAAPAPAPAVAGRRRPSLPRVDAGGEGTDDEDFGRRHNPRVCVRSAWLGAPS
jgi:hypothetical protein